MADGFSYEEMLKMQSEAAQRVKEMQRRTQEAVQRAKAKTNPSARKEGFDNTQKAHHNPRYDSKAKTTSLPLDYLGNQYKHSVINEVGNTSEAQEAERQLERARNNPSVFQSVESDRLLLTFIILLLASEESDDILLGALIYLFV